MFAKLKKKLEDETTEKGKVFLQGSTDASRYSLRRYNSSQLYDKQNSLLENEVHSESHHSKNPKTRSQDDLSNVHMDQLKKVQIRLKECLSELDESKAEKEKLETALEKQEESLKKRTENLEKEWQEKYELVELENSALQEKIKFAQALQNQFVQKQDAIDELEGFQTQEMAKIKHMLLNCQQELQQVKADLKTKSDECDAAKKSSDSLQLELKQVQTKSKDMENERNLLKEQESKNRELIKEIGDAKSTFEKEVQKLRNELQQTTAKATHSEMTVNNLRDENDALRHTHDIYCKQSITIIEEKESTISHLQERTEILEQRLANCDLSEDNLVQAVITERDGLEKKLEESRQQLCDIKSTWSEKIMALEKQISHLNEKIAEDSEELSSLESHGKHRENFLEDELNAKKTQLDETTKQIEEIKELMTRQNKQFDDERCSFAKEKAAHESLITDFKANLEKLQTEKTNLMTEKEKLQTALSTKISELEASATRCSESSKELQLVQERWNSKQIILEADLANARTNLEKATVDLTTCNKKLKEFTEQISCLEKLDSSNKLQIADLEKTISKHLNDLQNEIKGKKEVEIQRSKLEKKLREIETSAKQEKAKLQATIDELEKKLSSFTEEIAAIEKQKATMEDLRKENEDLHSQSVAMKEQTTSLQNEINDKNKTLRLQQQRINDMKKTFQKELKIQSLPSESANGDVQERDAVASFFQKENTDTQEFLQRLQALDVKEMVNGNEVNFRYLKHVILKFMTSREYEAQHLIRAVSVLLRFSPEEERLIKETLEWKMSWFGSKPEYGKGQMSKTIPTT